MATREFGVGDVLGRYRLDSELGRGGMGVVYLAHDTQLDRPAALKVINPGIGQDPQFRARFVREMRIAAQLEHPNVVPVHEAGEIDGALFIAMRYVKGEDLSRLIKREGGLGLERAAWVATQLGSALDAAHARGLVHRDVKPANVLLGGTADDPHLYLTDFGIAREAGSESALTNTGHWMGTIDYVAPEQLEGGLVSARSDIYAMGCVLFETLTGSVPFAGSIPRKLFAHSTEALPSVGAAGGEMTGAIDAVLARASAKDPADRYASAGDVGRALVGVVQDRRPSEERVVATGAALVGIPSYSAPAPIGPRPSEVPTERPAPVATQPLPRERPGPARRSRAGWFVAAALVIVAAAVAVVVSQGGSSDKGHKLADTHTPTPVPTASATTTPTPTATATAVTPTPTATSTSTPEPTSSAVPTGNPSDLNAKGFALYNTGHPEDAVPYLSAAVAQCGASQELDPCGYATFNLGLAYEAEGNYASAAQLMEHRLRRWPDDQLVIVHRALNRVCKHPDANC